MNYESTKKIFVFNDNDDLDKLFMLLMLKFEGVTSFKKFISDKKINLMENCNNLTITTQLNYSYYNLADLISFDIFTDYNNADKKYIMFYYIMQNYNDIDKIWDLRTMDLTNRGNLPASILCVSGY